MFMFTECILKGILAAAYWYLQKVVSMGLRELQAVLYGGCWIQDCLGSTHVCNSQRPMGCWIQDCFDSTQQCGRHEVRVSRKVMVLYG